MGLLIDIDYLYPSIYGHKINPKYTPKKNVNRGKASAIVITSFFINEIFNEDFLGYGLNHGNDHMFFGWTQ